MTKLSEISCLCAEGKAKYNDYIGKKVKPLSTYAFNTIDGKRIVLDKRMTGIIKEFSSLKLIISFKTGKADFSMMTKTLAIFE